MPRARKEKWNQIITATHWNGFKEPKNNGAVGQWEERNHLEAAWLVLAHELVHVYQHMWEPQGIKKTSLKVGETLTGGFYGIPQGKTLTDLEQWTVGIPLEKMIY